MAPILGLVTEKSYYNARADCSKMQKTNNMDSGLQMEDQLGLLIMRKQKVEVAFRTKWIEESQ